MEVRTEEERTPNHDGGKHTEPNETTPLTEPEYVVRRSWCLRSTAPHPPYHLRTPPCSWPSTQARSRNPGPEIPWLRNA